MKTTISLNRINDAVNFKATNSEGQSILMDGSASLGGINNGVRPMETLLMALAGCSAIDVVMILNKMKQKIDDMKIDVIADVKKVDDYKEYSHVHMLFHLKGEIKEEKLKKAIEMSINKYCSVAKTLEKTSKITYEFTLNTNN